MPTITRRDGLLAVAGLTMALVAAERWQAAVPGIDRPGSSIGPAEERAATPAAVREDAEACRAKPSPGGAMRERLIAARPIDGPAGWVSSDDYPRAAIRAEMQGSIRMMLHVEETGRVTGCIVSRSSGHPVLDAQACSLLSERGRYQPARDMLGCPIAQEVPLTFTWRLPE